MLLLTRDLSLSKMNLGHCPGPLTVSTKMGTTKRTRKLDPKSGFLNLKSHLPKLNSPIICWQHLFLLHTFATGPLLWCSTRHTLVPKPTKPCKAARPGLLQAFLEPGLGLACSGEVR